MSHLDIFIYYKALDNNELNQNYSNKLLIKTYHNLYCPYISTHIGCNFIIPHYVRENNTWIKR